MKVLCATLDQNIRFRLRMCIWKHWKTPQNRAKNLIKLGVYKKLAYSTAYNGARIAHCCQGGAMNVAVTKERLTRFGLVSMLDYYTKGVSLVKLIEPPCTERYARWCERSGNHSDFLLLDYNRKICIFLLYKSLRQKNLMKRIISSNQIPC